MGIRSNIDIAPILLSAESRLQNILIDAYAQADDRNIANLIATRIPTDGSEVKIRIFEPTVNFKTSLREDDVEFEDLTPTKVITVAPTFKHKGLRVGKSELADSNGEGASKINAWSEAAGSSAGLHTGIRAITLLKLNPLTEYDGLNLFATNHPTGYRATTFSNNFTGADISTAVTLEVANNNLSAVLAKINSIPTAANFALRYASYVIMVPTPLSLRAKQLTAARFLPAATGVVDNQVSATAGPYGVTVVEVPELGSAFTGVNADDKIYYIACKPLSGQAGLLLVDRQGLEMQMHGPQTSAELNRKNAFEWVARFRNEVIPGRPNHIFKCAP